MKNFYKKTRKKIKKYLIQQGFNVESKTIGVPLLYLYVTDYDVLVFIFSNSSKKLISIYYGQWCTCCNMFLAEDIGGTKVNINNSEELKNFISFIDISN